EVRLVRTVLGHRLVIRNPRKRRRSARLPFSEFRENAVQDRLDCVKDVVLRDEAHLKVELIELARRTVRAAVFLTKARCDLKVPVEPCNHEQLFKLLWRLWKGVEFPWMEPARHQEIARPFGRA